MYTYIEAKKKIESGEITSIEILEKLNKDSWKKSNFFKKPNERWEYNVIRHNLGDFGDRFEVSTTFVLKRVNEALTAINYNNVNNDGYSYEISFGEENKNDSEDKVEEKQVTLKEHQEYVELEFKRLNNRIDELQLMLINSEKLLKEMTELNHNLLKILN